MMENVVQNRISELKRAIRILESHLEDNGSNLQPKQFELINNQLNIYKRELKIRTDYPTHFLTES
ncbi:MAG: hypothetical protein GF317_04095 [Candidatus Lokiarchaeota archaeon]|nr:hypothetical protein [Candidatus Lokiarchaeota archaeon]MBD3199068.1 hypothetical protein [Candidatus Lokiarchaeota archaeon]